MSYFETNSFQIPNVLVDQLLTQLDPREVVCLLVIIRKTRGWHKERDHIPLSQFKKLTGITRDKSLYRVLDSLREKGFIRILKSRGVVNGYELTDQYKSRVGAESATTPDPVRVGAESATTPVAESASALPETSGAFCQSSKDINTKDSKIRGVEQQKENGHKAEVKEQQKENGHAAEVKSVGDIVAKIPLPDAAKAKGFDKINDRASPGKLKGGINAIADSLGVYRKQFESNTDFYARVQHAKSIDDFNKQFAAFQEKEKAGAANVE